MRCSILRCRPSCCGWAVTGIISRLVRASMLDVLGQDYVLAARAKGAGELRVLSIMRCAMR